MPRALQPSLVYGLCLGLLPVFLVSLLDDVKPQRAITRLAAQSLGAIVVMASGFVLNPAIPIEIEAVNKSNGQTAKEKVKDQFDKAWLALELGAGLEHKLGGGVGLQLDVRYVYGLANTAAVEGDSWKWRDIRVLAGVKFSL